MTRARFTSTAFARELTAHVCAWRRGYDGSSHPMFASWDDGVHPDFRKAVVDAVAQDEVKLHEYAAAVTSRTRDVPLRLPEARRAAPAGGRFRSGAMQRRGAPPLRDRPDDRERVAPRVGLTDGALGDGRLDAHTSGLTRHATLP
jgi:hypothetical protein